MLLAIICLSCTGYLERDARHLAMFQKQREKIIKMILRIDDPLQLNRYRQDLLVVTTKYKSYKNEMKMKYNNDEDWARFQEAYGKALE